MGQTHHFNKYEVASSFEFEIILKTSLTFYYDFKSGIGCGIYTTNSTEACEFILKDSKSQIVVVDNKAQLDKILALKSKFQFKAIIVYSDKIVDNHNGLIISVNIKQRKYLDLC